MGNSIIFFILAAIAIAAAVGMLTSRNAVHSALFLVLNFATIAVFYIILNAPFIGMVQITVYAGAIMVLFLFVIMLLGAERMARTRQFDWQAPMAVVMALILIVEAVYVIFFRDGASVVLAQSAPDFAAPVAIGTIFFQEYFLPFQITGVLLLVAMIGAIVITKQEKKKRS